MINKFLLAISAIGTTALIALVPGKALALDYTCADFDNTHIGYTPAGDEYCQTENSEIRVAIVNGV